MSSSNSGKSQRDEREHESQQRAAIAAFLAAHHCDRTRGMMISTTAEKWVGVIADKDDVAQKVVWCLTRIEVHLLFRRLTRGSIAHLDGIMRQVRHWPARCAVSAGQRATHILQCHHLIN